MINHSVEQCCFCSQNLKNSPVQFIVERQVFDIPPSQMSVTAHRAERKFCSNCGHYTQAAFPQNVRAPTQYGPILKSYALYLQAQQLLPDARLQDLFKDLFGASISQATLRNISLQGYHNLEYFEAFAVRALKSAAIKHLDETGFRVSAKTCWLNVLSNDQWTYYRHSKKRGALLDGLTGLVVHDHWKPYYKLEGVLHALCNAHHLRELNALIEDKELWAHQMQRLLKMALHLKNTSESVTFSEYMLPRILSMYDRILAFGFKFHESQVPFSARKGRGRLAKRKGHNLLLRLKNHREDVLRFCYNREVPFTNNQAERDLRMMKVKQKISGGFGSEEGASVFCRIRSYISTAKKQGWNIMSILAQAITPNYQAAPT